MFLEATRVRNDARRGDERGDRTFPSAPIGNGVEVSSVGVPLERPLDSAALTPILLLLSIKLQKALLQVIR
jgi:hypothetical protein